MFERPVAHLAIFIVFSPTYASGFLFRDAKLQKL
jgi:hypothetical protein